MGKKRYTILLFFAVTLMLGNTGINIYRHYIGSPASRQDYHVWPMPCMGKLATCRLRHPTDAK
jgi:hypothetical protein